MRFADLTTINSALSNAVEPTRQSRHVLGVSTENRTPMTRCHGASQIPQRNEGCEPHQGVTLRTPPANGPAVAGFKTDLQQDSNDAA
jgi:hypothetical protein